MWEGRKTFEDITVRDVMIPVRDGTRLAGRLYLPGEDGRYATLYAASPYQFVTDGCPASDLFLWYEVGPLEWYVRDQGYAFLHLDVRGTGQSEGEWRVWDATEQIDHYDVVEWIAQQPWSSGRVGGYGQSYYAVSQWLMAIQRPPHLTCIAPYDGFTEPYTDAFYHGGIPSGFGAVWYDLNVRMQSGLLNAAERGRIIRYDAIADWIEHNTNDEYWQERSAQSRLTEVEVPVFSIGLWGKRTLHLRGNIRGWEGVCAPKWLLVDDAVDAWEAHRRFADSGWHSQNLLPFYDHFLKGVANSFESSPPVTIAVVGRQGRRTWSAWPPDAQHAELYLAPGPTGTVNSLNDGALTDKAAAAPASTSYAYPDPEWRIGNAKIGRWGPDFVRRNLTFTSEPLPEDTDIVGHASLSLYASSDQVDTDFVITISDQAPLEGEAVKSGRQPASTLIARGWLRASHRALDPALSSPRRPIHRHVEPKPLVPGEIYLFEIEISACAYRIPAGHRIRLEISATDSSLNEGPFAHHYSWQRVGVDTFYHDEEHASCLFLPILPAELGEPT
jgi:predicted acyl esterase